VSVKTISRWISRFVFPTGSTLPAAGMREIWLSLAILAILLAGCAPRPQTWPSQPENPALTSTWHIDVARFLSSAHGGVACETCHADIAVGETSMPHPDVTRLTLSATSLYDYSTCARCHPQEYADYDRGAHAAARAQSEGEGEPSPTCGHCHSSHYAAAYTRAELLSNVAETCGTCHPEELESYRADYHGKAALLGYEQAATCTDCHGAHAVSSLYDVGETVQACRRCHPEVNASTASYRVHARETLNAGSDDTRAQESALLFWVKLFFTVLVVSVLAFFYTHTLLWFLRSLHERLKKGRHG